MGRYSEYYSELAGYTFQFQNFITMTLFAYLFLFGSLFDTSCLFPLKDLFAFWCLKLNSYGISVFILS